MGKPVNAKHILIHTAQLVIKCFIYSSYKPPQIFLQGPKTSYKVVQVQCEGVYLLKAEVHLKIIW